MARRIRKGFHRIGAVGAVFCIVAALLSLLVVVAKPGEPDLAPAAAAWLVFGGVFYLLAWGLGWIIAGFMSDQNPAQRG